MKLHACLRMPRSTCVRGHSLIELLVVLAITAMLATQAVPSLITLVASLQLRSAANTLVQDLSLARSEAIKRNGRVVICKSQSGRACESVAGWGAGWLIFLDLDNDGQLGPQDLLIRQQAGFAQALVFHANTPVANYVSYTPLGTSRYVSGGIQAGMFTVCQQSPDATQARDIYLSSTGRTRVVKRDISRCPEA